MSEGGSVAKPGGQGHQKNPSPEGAQDFSPAKFPPEYMFELTEVETSDLRSNFPSAKLSSKSRVSQKAFTEKGLYMLATILKSPQATTATFAIIAIFAKVRALKRELLELHGVIQTNEVA